MGWSSPVLFGSLIDHGSDFFAAEGSWAVRRCGGQFPRPICEEMWHILGKIAGKYDARVLCGPVNMVPEWSSNESSSDSTGLLDGSFSRHVSREMPQEHLHPCGAGMFGNYAQSEKLSHAIKISWRLQRSFRWHFSFQSCDPKWYVNHLLECDMSYDSWFWTNSRCFGLCSIQCEHSSFRRSSINYHWSTNYAGINPFAHLLQSSSSNSCCFLCSEVRPTATSGTWCLKGKWPVTISTSAIFRWK